MADQHIDIARMVMQAQYEMQLEREASSVQGGELSDMEREDYQKRINDLLNAVTTLLDANNAMGEKLQRLEKIADAYEDLKAENEKLKGELAMRKRGHYGKGSEKPKDDSSSDEKTKDDDENDYIENGSKRDVPPVEDPEDEERSPSEPPVKKERDLSNRPEHYEKGHADIHVVHDCDLDKLEELGLEFIRYTRPVDQEYIDKIGVLYKVELESILLHRTEAEVLNARKIESIPINELDQQSALLLAKVKSKELKISSKREHAINYMRNHWKELIAYIDIGNVLIDNNCCERAVRPFTNLRKSFGGFSSELGGEVAAAWLTFVESCKLQKKAALEVFNGYFQRIAQGRRDYDLITEEVLC